MRFHFDPLIIKQALRPMIRIKSATDTPDFKSPSRHAKEKILVCLSVGVTPRAD